MCGRCSDPKIADIFPAIKIGPRPGRPLPDPDNKELRTATAMLKAITWNDLGDLAFSASDPIALLFGFAQLTKSRRVVAP